MDKEDEKELEYLFAHVNRLWAGLVVLIGGLVGMVLSMPFSLALFSIQNTAKLVLFVFGLILAGLMITGLTNTDYKINKKIKRG
jgi:hypothetical protein